MSKYLKLKQEYIDLYDRLTVEDCRWRENFHKNSKPSEELAKQVSDKFYSGVTEIALHYDLLYATIKWHEGKEERINEWIARDTQKDELYENAEAPRGIRCLKCQSLVTSSSKLLYDSREDKEDRILFMYDCPNGCVPHRAFFNDGEEYKTKPNLCIKCKSVLERSNEKIEGKKIITTETCQDCGHIETDEFELSVEKEKLPDPDYEKDRERFCLSGEALSKNLLEKSQLEQVAKFMDKWNEKEKHKDLYDKVDKLKKLKIIDLEKLLSPILEKSDYVKLQFRDPDITRDVFVPFVVYDQKTDREGRSSTYELEKLLRKTLKYTNWRMVTGGVSYRLGMLEGRLHGYEKEEDLLKLIKSDN